MFFRSTVLDVFYMCLFLKACLSSLEADTISEDYELSGDSTIVSAQRVFELGFIQPSPSSNYYIAIWYKKDPSRRTVWVANRENPVSGSSKLRISNGNLVLFDESETLIWSTNVTSPSRSVQATLLDTGNLVLLDRSSDSSNYLWQSFDHPTHVWLPGGKLRYDKRTKTSQALISWKNSEDPAPGIFSYQVDPSNNSTSLFWNMSKIYWNTGSWNGYDFSLMPSMRFDYASSFNYESNENESYFIYIVATNIAVSVFLEMRVSGQVGLVSWLSNRKEWDFCPLPQHRCAVYALCGPNGICSEESSKLCFCLPGFEVRSQRDWDLNDYSGGCVRMTKLSCENNTKENIRFFEVPNLSLPENKIPLEVLSSKECESNCRNDCSCVAYVYDHIGCSIWTGDLINLKQLGAGDTGRISLNIRESAYEYQRLKGSSQKWKIYLSLFFIIAAAMFTCCATCLAYHVRNKKTDGKQDTEILLADSFRSIHLNEDEEKGIDVQCFALARILEATNNFSEANKLGQGGFGPVYKGTFSGGKEIAIKRLLNDSGQGLIEFKNEVLLIAKLQHRNLVRLLGYCIERDEKILLYEYMPNKSLDSFLFDQDKCVILNWETRFNIILGIARGLLYLHHDSRLRIIHRDLKTSNVLLDEEMNPKISDFGLARSFGGKELEARTRRVVGTVGYMSPEYAIKGLFSIKSDVFAFGVVIIEILSGIRNTSSRLFDEDLSLLGYAWKLWIENKAEDLMDPVLSQNCDKNEFMRCLGVGLLCVQEDPNDRPVMSNVITMLVGENGSVAQPNQPAFVVRKSLSRVPLYEEQLSKNELTNTLIHGR